MGGGVSVVYFIMHWSEYGDSVHGVYATRSLAKNVCRKLNMESTSDSYDVYEEVVVSE